MLETLKKINDDIEIISVFDTSFKLYGEIIEIDTEEIVNVGKSIEITNNIQYFASFEPFEKLSITNILKTKVFGGMPIQTGVCFGHGNKMNATEWHTSNEVNIAITDMVLILGKRWDIRDNMIDSSKFKVFYVPCGTAIELYSTTLHYCPCNIDDGGFASVVVLLQGTNTLLEENINDKRITAKNKWILAHVENDAKIKQGAVPGISGINIEIKAI